MVDVDNDMFVFGKYETINIRVKKNATNGDVIKALFDVKDIETMKCCVFVTIYPDYNTRFIKEWWNAPYKRGE